MSSMPLPPPNQIYSSTPHSMSAQQGNRQIVQQPHKPHGRPQNNMHFSHQNQSSPNGPSSSHPPPRHQHTPTSQSSRSVMYGPMPESATAQYSNQWPTPNQHNSVNTSHPPLNRNVVRNGQQHQHQHNAR